MEKKIELVKGIRVTIETKDDGSTITICEKEETPSYQFKVGDVVSINNGESLSVFIITNVSDSNCIGITACGTNILRNKSLCSLVSFEKKVQFAKEFFENNFRWNPVLKKVEKIKWMPKRDKKYFYMSNWGEIFQKNYAHTILDDEQISIGNFFKTKEQAEAASERVKKLFAEIQAELYK